MIPLLPPLFDPANLAHAVREIASDAHRLLNDPNASDFELRELVSRISSLLIEVQGQPNEELSRWLDSARRRIEAV